MEENEVQGNILIYFMFQISNYSLSVLGFFTLCVTIYLTVLTKSLNWFNFYFFLFGFGLIALSVVGCYLKHSVYINFIYCIILTVLFGLDCLVTLIMFIDKELIMEWIIESEASMTSNPDTTKETLANVKIIIEANLKIANTIFLIILCIFVWLLYILIFTHYYRL